MKKFGKLFETPAAMAFCTLVAAFAGLLSGILFHFADDAPNVQHILFVLQGVIALYLLVAYDKHDKNVMKGLLGAMLTTLVISELSYFYGTFQSILTQMREISTVLVVISLLIEILICVAMALVFITHFVINSDHHSSPALVKINQYLLVVILALILVQKLFKVCALGTTMEMFIAVLVWIVLEVCSFGTVVCIESKLDAYRKKREGNDK